LTFGDARLSTGHPGNVVELVDGVVADISVRLARDVNQEIRRDELVPVGAEKPIQVPHLEIREGDAVREAGPWRSPSST
jgi:hypothetical protein